MISKRLFFSVILMAILVTACGAQPTEVATVASVQPTKVAPTTPVEPIKIGFVGDLSESWALTDTPYLDGAKFAIDQINAAGGVLGRPLEIIVRDGKNDNSLTIRYTGELIDQGVVYFLGTVSEALIAGGAVACKAGVPISTGIGSADTLIMDIGDCAFMVMMADTTQGAVAAQYAYEDLGYRTAYILLSTEFPYVENLPRYFEETFERLGGEVLGEDQFIDLGGDYSAQVTNIASLDTLPDVIFTSMIVPDTNLFLRQLRAAGVDTPVIGPDGFDNVGILDAGKVAEGVLFTTSALDYPDSKIDEFYNLYESKTGKRPDVAYYADAYDEIYMLKQIIETAGSADKAAIMEGLKNLKGFEGITGTWNMGPDRRVDRPIFIVEIKNNKYNFVTLMSPDWKPQP
jgi:branched-chain amino acid transport system substrate-binding protein